MQKKFAEFGGQGMLVERRSYPPLNLPALPAGKRQRGILSEVIKHHDDEETIGCKLAPGTGKPKLIRCNSVPLKSRTPLPKPVDFAQVVKTRCDVAPKVVEVYSHAAGDRPRKVTVERRLRAYAANDIAGLLLDQGVPTRAHWDVGQSLPLMCFDDTDYDIHSCQEWIALGNGLPITGEGFRIDGASGRWELCEIASYLEPDPKNPATFGRFQGHFVTDMSPCSLTRLEVCFFGEDPVVFTARVCKAIKARRNTNDAIKFNFFVDNMPDGDISGVDSDSITRIIELSRSSELIAASSRALEGSAAALVKEVNLDFSRTMNKLTLKHMLTQHAAGQRTVGLDDTDMGDLSLDHLALPENEIETVTPVREYALCPVPQESFTQSYSNFCFSCLYIKPEVVTTLREVLRENIEILEKECMYCIKFPLHVRLDQFKGLHKAHFQKTAHNLQHSWVNSVKKIMLTNFKNIEKGWFNIYETQNDTYAKGKLKKCITRLRFMMEDVLRDLTTRSVEEYKNKIVSICPTKIVVKSLHEVQCLGETSAEGKGMFLTDVKINTDQQEQVSNQPEQAVESTGPAKYWFEYTTEGSQFVESSSEVITQGLREICDIPQVEKLVVPQIFKTIVSKQVMNCVHIDEDFVVEAKKKIEEKLALCAPALTEYIRLLDPYVDLLSLDPKKYVDEKNTEENPASMEELRADISVQREKGNEWALELPESLRVGPFTVMMADIKNSIAQKYKTVESLEINLLVGLLRDKCADINAAFNLMKNQVTKTACDIEELTEIKEYMETIPSELAKQQLEIQRMTQIYSTLEGFNVKLSLDDGRQRWRCFSKPRDLLKVVEEVKVKHLELCETFMEGVAEEQVDFEGILRDLDDAVLSFNQFLDLDDAQNTYEYAVSIEERIAAAKAQVKQFNQREALFGKEPTDYVGVNNLVKAWEPFMLFWTIARNWVCNKEQWFHGDFNQFDAADCQSKVNSGVKMLSKCIKAFQLPEPEEGEDAEGRVNENEGMLDLCTKIQTELVAFQVNLPLVVGLRNEGMRDRHWEAITELVGAPVSPQMDKFCLQSFLDLNMLAVQDKIEEIGDRSGKEYSIEKQLATMKAEWDPIEFDCSETYRTTGTYILKGSEEVNGILDEHIVMTQAMQFSPFNKPFKEEIDEWAVKLLYVSECVEQWLKVQRAWMYLQPIFDSPDIMKQLPLEGKKFKQVDGLWRQTMKRVHDNNHALTNLSTENLVDKWKQADHDLELVQKGLDDYLQTKRDAFARFYFLSNDELLEILSQTKDPTRVQPFLCKVFEAMKKVNFLPDMSIDQMFSGEGEVVKFVNVRTTQGKNVEAWMNELENEMRESVRKAMEHSVVQYADVPRPEWVLVHPGQCVLNGSQVYWTSETEEAIDDGQLDEYMKKCESQLMDLVMLVRGNITKLQRTSIGALVVIDVHAKDVIERLARENVSQLSAFEWISQLRYYWELDDTNRNNLWIRMVQTTFPYGYEYLGNTFRLVITPLTDMCYMTLMGAQTLNLGGSPAGPAGTGKTETTKDLAKALAKQCVVFNCSPEMDYIMVGKFFKGLAVCGAWCCFDEFNRIYIEVLSVIAQQLLVLFGAKASLLSYSETKELDFEGAMITMKPTFNVFITMNPGYAGRTELPDNLEALFRPMAMMVPDYGLIGEIMFYAFGFTGGRPMAKKMVSTFKLSSEQLSSQDHYDYGMRAVKTVIEAAGRSKRLYPDLEEYQILLRALNDVNVPKFLKDDLPLFRNIILDLFPETEQIAVNYGELMAALKNTCESFILQPTAHFMLKVTELYDMVQVRHGMMLVGETGGGKTMNYRTLGPALGQLKPDDGNFDSTFQKTITHILNPKAITQAQLYGAFDEVTHEWTDGIASEQIRIAVKDVEHPDFHWIIFDGPVDALWIESMNTVLDDNKKLCLVSGEIIALTPQIRMMFEVEDLAVASPATVSRCGMIFMEPSMLGMEPMIDSWAQKLPETFTLFAPTYGPQLVTYCKEIMVNSISFVKKMCTETLAAPPVALASGCFKLLDTFFRDYYPTELKPAAQFKNDVVKLARSIADIFLFCVLWSVGGTIDGKSRGLFNDYLWVAIGKDEQLRESKRDPKPIGWDYPPVTDDMVLEGVPEGLLLYEYLFSPEENRWIPWMETIRELVIPRVATYDAIVVPSVDSVRMTHLLKVLAEIDQHVLCCGNTGTGKTVNVCRYLQKSAPSNFQSVFLSFSAQTQVNQVQDMIDSKLDKRRRGVYGPPAGKKMPLFVDDLNMPQKEFYGAQPPIELLRQWMDHRGWYNRKELTFFEVTDLILVAAMGPPGGGRSFITNRLVRHYNLLGYVDLQDAAIANIFSTLTTHFFQTFDDTVKEVLPGLVNGIKSLFRKILGELLPTPAKAHYLFNLRDIWKTFLGVCSLSPKKANDPLIVVKCWCHEIYRTFGDRLINQEDRTWMDDAIKTELTDTLEIDPANVFNQERLIFANFLEKSVDARLYQEITDLEKMKVCLEDYLDDYNSFSSKTMPLVIFLDFAEHVARVCRVQLQPQGNVLLLGVGGSGRQSSTRLACFVNDFDCFQIEVSKGYGMNEFKEDIKTCLMKCGVEDKVQNFLFCDTQIVNEQFVETMNNILNSGDVPNLYKVEDTDTIAQACRSVCQQLELQPTKANIFAAYLSRVKKNMHAMLAFSPVGDAFRNRIRMFPSLVNCCTIDWFREWPAEALYSVAKQEMTVENLKLPDLESILKMFSLIHQSVEGVAQKFKEEQKRFVYVTPTSYLELLASFKKVLDAKRKHVGMFKDRYQVGLDKISDAEKQVTQLQEELTVMGPVLVKTQAEVSEMMTHIEKDKADAAIVQAQCEEQEAGAQVKAAECQAIKDDAQRDLDEALPALEQAVQCLKKLKMDHLREVKALANPPAGVRLTMEGMCIMFGIPPVKKNDPHTLGKKIDDYWEASQKHLLNDPKKLLDNLFSYDRDNIPDKVIANITPYITREDFDPAAIKKASVACEAMCMWTRAMHLYNRVAKAVEPKRQKLRRAEEELQVVMESLKSAQDKLAEVNARLAKLEDELSKAVEKKDDLQRQSDMCTAKLDRAGKLIGGLGGEKARWGENVVHLTKSYRLLPGDCMVASGSMSYSGPFAAEYRQELEEQWRGKLDDLAVEYTEGCSLRNILGDPVKIQSWVVCQLPNDALSVENAIIIDQSRRWPLAIDPQRQANKYIKNVGRGVETGFDVCKLSDANFLRTLELGIQFGKWVLLENIGIDLDPALEPILLQQKTKEGSGWTIKLGDKSVAYLDSFRLFLTTTLPNPHYSPETSVKVTLLNFSITLVGLEDQLLGIVVAKERNDLQEAKEQLVVQNAKMNKQLKELEDEILRLLATSEGDILEDDKLITVIASSKHASNEIAVKQQEAKVTEKEIDVAREKYRPVAYRASILFFSIVELTNVDPMYQFSCQWFQTLFALGVDAAKPDEDLEVRLENLKSYFTESLYQNVCRGLFEKDKLMFSFAMCLRILQGDNNVDMDEMRFLLTGPTKDLASTGPASPAPWVLQKMMNEILTISELPAFEGFADYFIENVDKFKTIFDSNDADTMPLPSLWEEKLTRLEKLCFLRCIRLDKLIPKIISFVSAEIGQKFVEPPTFDIEKCYNDSTNVTSLIFILSSGSDPVADVLAFADRFGMSKKLESISLGQGQGPKAVKMIEDGKNSGGWVLLQNCHLAISWMPKLESLCEQFHPDHLHKNFRLWLTSMPSPSFPVQILQNGVKMTNEPPKGLRANLMRSYSGFTDALFAESEKPSIFKKLLFGFCFFHAVVQDRRKYGPIGWNIPYSFTNEDLNTCKRQLMTFVNQYDEVPYKVLNYLGSAINYGGRVTDDKDKRLIQTILETYICEDVVDEGAEYKFSASGEYYCPDAETVEGFMEYIRNLSLAPAPEAFGMDENCNITCAENEALNILAGILTVSSKGSGGGGGQSREEVMEETAKTVLAKTPQPFDPDFIELKYPSLYEESMNTVLKQECIRYNNLLVVMLQTLPAFRKALKGLVVMSSELEALGNELFINGVPSSWAEKGFLSLKPLSSWVIELNDRISFLLSWIENGKPFAFWISGLFFPQAFLTGALQNFSRRYTFAIDRLEFTMTILDEVKDPKDITEHPKDGINVYGIFLEGCRWSRDEHTLRPSIPKELFSEFPTMLFVPTLDRASPSGTYSCPVYKVLSRRGVLSTTGHSTNFVMYLDVPSEDAQQVWTRAGVAAFLALKF